MENTKIFKYPTCFTTVDIVVHDSILNRVLLAKKPKQDLHRFVGGFTDDRRHAQERDILRHTEEMIKLAYLIIVSGCILVPTEYEIKYIPTFRKCISW